MCLVAQYVFFTFKIPLINLKIHLSVDSGATKKCLKRKYAINIKSETLRFKMHKNDWTWYVVQHSQTKKRLDMGLWISM